MHITGRLPNEVPILETERLLLRPHRAEDLEVCTALWSEPEVVRYTTGKPLGREEVWVRILRHAGTWAMLGFGFWAVEEKASGEFAGEVGFMERKREIEPPLEGKPEAGWGFASRFHGKGYATEAMRAALAWGDEHFGATPTVCIIHEGNAASVRVAAKCGYREYARTIYQEHQVTLFARSMVGAAR